MILPYACAVLLWLSMITYATLGGADFGGGIWDLFSLGPEQENKRQLIVRALGPVWEANNVWFDIEFPISFCIFSMIFGTVKSILWRKGWLPFVGNTVALMPRIRTAARFSSYEGI